MKSAVTFMKLIRTRDCANIYYKQPHVNRITLQMQIVPLQSFKQYTKNQMLHFSGRFKNQRFTTSNLMQMIGHH